MKDLYKGILIDNYDSFTYNVAQYFGELGTSIDVVRNDEVDLNKIDAYDFIVISPGPSSPKEAGQCMDVIKHAEKKKKPLLGICLGHQCIAEYFGARIMRMDPPIHGKTSDINHSNSGVFKNLSLPFVATRYHSLIIDKETMPPELIVSATSSDHVIQAIEHKSLPIVGVQFHPESVLTTQGISLLDNFLKEYVAK